MQRRSMVVAGSIVPVVFAAGLLVAGPLSPPVGSVTSSYKTLGEVEPRIALSAANTPGDGVSVFRITQPGSYYLTGNLSVPTGRSGVVIAAGGVTLDLSGYQISGQSGSLSGVTTLGAAHTNVTLRNGTIAVMGGDGVALGETNSGTIENVHVRSAGGNGILVGRSSLLRDSSVSTSGANGIVLGFASIAERCTSLANAASGFVSEFGATLRTCSARDNSGAGFEVNQSSLIDCFSSSNDGNGFETGFRSRLVGCTSQHNLLVGIRGLDGATIEGCMVTNNARQGIHVSNQCLVSKNHVTFNGGTTYAGIWLDGVGNRCEDNLASSNAYGLFTGGSDNFVVRNTCRANTLSNFITQNVNSNEVAPVISNPGGGGFSTATPWSNFIH
ncbi:MAG: right-handed parallel beta-helix repeat-containing protein [Planctomycetota bacterium]|nr:right-handed parallel beta-helix repeat-containing protein [Planctomycetota bacterium]